MRWRFLAVLALAAGCARMPSLTEEYSKAWDIFHRGNLDPALSLVQAALHAHSREPDEALAPLRLLEVEILLSRGLVVPAQATFGKIPKPQDPLNLLRWSVDRAD